MATTKYKATHKVNGHVTLTTLYDNLNDASEDICNMMSGWLARDGYNMSTIVDQIDRFWSDENTLNVDIFNGREFYMKRDKQGRIIECRRELEDGMIVEGKVTRTNIK
jgi:hypothetical protein